MPNNLQKAVTKREAGQDFPAAAFAYVPDPNRPSTWKLRLWDDLEQKATAAQVGRAVAALGPSGYRGNRVQIPAEDLPRVKAVVLRVWLEVNSDQTKADAPAFLKNMDGEYGEEEDIECDPLDYLLDAYVAAVKYGPTAYFLIDPIIGLARDLESVYRTAAAAEATAEQYSKALGMTPGMAAEATDEVPENPIESLVCAYSELIYTPQTAAIRAKLLQIIAKADAALIGDGVEVESYEEDMGSMSTTEDAAPVMREIRREGSGFAVISTTGRRFGTYATHAAAAERLAQIESFAAQKVATASARELGIWRANLQRIPAETPALVTVKNLIDDRLEEIRPLMKAAKVSNSVEEQRYTLGPVYVPNTEDAHGEWTDAPTLQKALWGWIQKGDRTIYLQHSDKPAGEMVEMMTLPWPVTASLTVPNQGTTDHTFPAETPFMGVVWEPWAWDLVKAGELRGYSIGGRAHRVEVDLPTAATV